MHRTGLQEARVRKIDIYIYIYTNKKKRHHEDAGAKALLVEVTMNDQQKPHWQRYRKFNQVEKARLHISFSHKSPDCSRRYADVGRCGTQMYEHHVSQRGSCHQQKRCQNNTLVRRAPPRTLIICSDASLWKISILFPFFCALEIVVWYREARKDSSEDVSIWTALQG